MTMPYEGDAGRPPNKSSRYGRDAERVWYLVLCAVCLVLIAAGAIAAASVKPGFCSTCHTSESKALAASPHARIACDSCHTEPSVAGVLDSRLSVIGMVPAQLTRGSQVFTATVNKERCLGCHKQILERVTVSGGLRMNHRALYEANWPCTTCHPRIAHATSKRPIAGYTMDTCLKCHAPNTYDLSLCDTCHVKGDPPTRAQGLTTPWRITHGANWRQTHGMGDLTTCAACHREDYCVSCHGMRLPHPGTFAAQHGQQVLQREDGATDCYVCHRQSTCENCHGIEMPHPSGFLKTHSKTVSKSGDAVCVRCHDKSSCTDCHLKHVHPGIPTDIIKRLRERPAT